MWIQPGNRKKSAASRLPLPLRKRRNAQNTKKRAGNGTLFAGIAAYIQYVIAFSENPRIQ